MRIALLGKMRGGKNTVADYLTNSHGYKQFAFGTGIGKIIKDYFPTAFDGGKPRQHYQHIGQALRELDKDVWVNYLLKDVADYEEFYDLHYGKATNVVVTDTRQVNEVERLRENGFVIVKVVCPEDIRLERIKASGDNFTEEQLNHDTELQVDLSSADLTIYNDRGLDDLYDEIEFLLEKIREGDYANS